MKVISFYDSGKREHWLEEIKKSDWRAGAFLYRLLTEGGFFETYGESSKVLLLTDEDRLVSFCTYAERDEIQPTELTPWIGFVYTFPQYRGHRYAGLLFDEAERLAGEEGVKALYLCTGHAGLYEKYGFEFIVRMTGMHGDEEDVYVREVK